MSKSWKNCVAGRTQTISKFDGLKNWLLSSGQDFGKKFLDSKHVLKVYLKPSRKNPKISFLPLCSELVRLKILHLNRGIKWRCLQVNKYESFLRIVNKLWLDGKKVAGKPQLNRRSYNRWVSVVEFHDPTIGIGKVFGQESTVIKWNYQILGLHLVTVRQK